MAQSTCPKCTSTAFEIKELTVRESNFRLMAVQCSSCGAVVSVQEYNNIGEAINRLANQLGVTLD